jgi:hypothetical protein
MYFIFIYGNIRMQAVEIVLMRAEKENNGGLNLTNIYYKHICKHHNKPMKSNESR